MVSCRISNVRGVKKKNVTRIDENTWSGDSIAFAIFYYFAFSKKKKKNFFHYRHFAIDYNNFFFLWFISSSSLLHSCHFYLSS